MRKLTYEQVEKEFNEAGYALISTNYTTVNAPMKCKDKSGYTYAHSLGYIRQLGKYNKMTFDRPFDIRNEYHWENILYYMENNVDNGTRLLSSHKDYTSHKDKLLFQCGRCGKTFRRTWKSFTNLDNKICQICYKEIRPLEPYVDKRRNSINKYIKAAEQIDLKVLSTKVLSVKDNVVVEDKNGFKGTVNAEQLLHGCSFDKFSIYHNPYVLYNLQLLIEKDGFKTKVLEIDEGKKTDSYKSKVRVQCECGEIFECNMGSITGGNKRLCNKCTRSQSFLETLVKKWLEDNQIQFVQQKSFNGLVGIGNRSLKFDFYIPSKNCCIEVNGIQHYKPTTFGETDINVVNNNFITTVTHDKRKKKYCSQNNIKLLVIPFWLIEKSNKYKDILQTSLLKCDEL